MSETVARINDLGMITLRCDISILTKITVPDTRKIVDNIAWMSPDELLVIVPKDDVPAVIAKLEDSVKGLHHLIADVSDARMMFQLSGPNAREVLAKGAPVDLSPDAFQPGDIRRTRIGQVAAAFWMVDAQTFRIICFTSVAGYLEEWLRHAARPEVTLSHF